MDGTRRRFRARWLVGAHIALVALLAACGAAPFGPPSGSAIVGLVEPTSTPTPTATPTATPIPTPTATATRPSPTVTPTRTPSPTRAATRIANSAIADFGAWDVGDSDPPGRYRSSYDAATGEYLVEILEEATDWTLPSPDKAGFKDFRLEVEARRVAGADSVGYGLVFRRQARAQGQAASERYIFYVTAQGFYIFYAVGPDGKNTILKDLTPAPGVARVGDSPNKMAVVCRGSEIRLLINDQQVFVEPNAKLLQAGSIGILAASSTTGGPNAKLAFKNIALFQNP